MSGPALYVMGVTILSYRSLDADKVTDGRLHGNERRGKNSIYRHRKKETSKTQDAFGCSVRSDIRAMERCPNQRGSRKDSGCLR